MRPGWSPVLADRDRRELRDEHAQFPLPRLAGLAPPAHRADTRLACPASLARTPIIRYVDDARRQKRWLDTCFFRRKI